MKPTDKDKVSIQPQFSDKPFYFKPHFTNKYLQSKPIKDVKVYCEIINLS